jgi:hypothetical protein
MAVELEIHPFGDFTTHPVHIPSQPMAASACHTSRWVQGHSLNVRKIRRTAASLPLQAMTKTGKPFGIAPATRVRRISRPPDPAVQPHQQRAHGAHLVGRAGSLQRTP